MSPLKYTVEVFAKAVTQRQVKKQPRRFCTIRIIFTAEIEELALGKHVKKQIP
jgi:hypothetical protein